MENLLEIKEMENEYKSIINKNKRLKNVLSDKKEINNNLRNQIKEVKEKLSFVLEKVETGLWEWNIEDDRIVYNKEWAKILDYHLNKLDGRLETWRDLIHIEDRDEFDEIVNKIKAGKKKNFEFEHRLKTGNGEWKWMLASGKAFKENEKGEIIEIIGIHKDINLFKTLENKLEKKKESFEEIFNNLPFAMMIYKNDEWQFINKTAEKVLGYSAQELLGSNNWSFIDSDYLKWIKKEKNKSRKTFYDLKIIDKKGNEKLVDFYAGKINVGKENTIILVAKEK
ncbi:MAG: PAS domain-containing protein [Bacillota bacterium]